MYLLSQLKSKQIYLTNRLFLIKSEKAAHFETNVKSFLKKSNYFLKEGKQKKKVLVRIYVDKHISGNYDQQSISLCLVHQHAY